MSGETWAFSVWQSGVTVASGYAPSEEQARREAMHYGAMYAQDGEVEVRVRRTRPRVPSK